MIRHSKTESGRRKTHEKLISIFTALVLALSLPAMADNTTTFGILSYLNMTEVDSSGLTADDYKILYYDSIDAMLMALNAGEITAILDLPQTTTQYIIAQNDQLVAQALFNREKIEADGGFALDCYKIAGSGFSFTPTAGSTWNSSKG